MAQSLAFQIMPRRCSSKQTEIVSVDLPKRCARAAPQRGTDPGGFPSWGDHHRWVLTVGDDDR